MTTAHQTPAATGATPDNERRTMTFGPMPDAAPATAAVLPTAKLAPSGRRPTAKETADIQARRAAVHEKARQDAAADSDIDLAPPAAPREDVESVELQMPDGRKVLFGPPPGISLMLRVSQILGPAVQDLMLNGLTRTLLCIREVDGKSPAPLRTAMDVQKAALRWGDPGLNYLMTVYAKYWPAVSVDDLPVLKKNLRES